MRCYNCEGSGIVAGEGEYTTVPCWRCDGEGVIPCKSEIDYAIKSARQELWYWHVNRRLMKAETWPTPENENRVD